MRCIKTHGLAMAVAVAAMALVGAAGAQAAPHQQVGLCKAQELVLCAAGNLIPVNSGQLLATATDPKFVGNLNELCVSSKAVASVTGALDEVGKLKFSITSLTFTGCKPCTSVTVITPLAAELTMSTTLGNDWKFPFAGHIIFTGCPFGVTCKFGSEATTLIEMSEGGTTLNTNEAVFALEEGSAFICGSSAKWIAKYSLKWTLNDGTEHNAFPTLLGTA
jgi:hypothetical protein